MTRKKRHLLLVEDDDDHRELICRAFDSQAEEMRVTVACTLKEARAALAATVPDLVITDLELPDGRGIELVPVDMEATPYPVVIMTGRGNERVAVEAMKAGALDYVIKSEETLGNMPHIADSALREWGQVLQRRQAEANLRASEAQYQDLYEHAPDMFASVDAETGNIARCNHTLTLATGYTKEEIVGHHISKLYPSELRDYVSKTVFQPFVSTGKVNDAKLQLQCKDGSRIEVSLNVSALRDEQGRVVLSRSVWRDITEQSRAKEQLQKMNFHLEELVSKRTSDLKQVIIVLENENAHRKAAELRMRDALSEKEVLLMELHHRIKNNLQLISSMLNLQATSMGSEQALQLARDCDRRLQTMAHVHDQLYDAVNLSQIKLSEYVRQIVNQVMLPNSRSAPSIDVIIDTKAESLSVDQSIPCGLLLNELVTNVAKHAFPQPADHALKSERRGELRIECYVDEEKRFVLSVSDNGVGLPANVDFDHGTSSGVRLVRALVKQLKGTIAVHRGGGTRVTILFTATLDQSSDNAPGVKPLIQLV